MDVIEIRKRITNQRFTARLNEHATDCQLCQQGGICDTVEQMVIQEESRIERLRKANQIRKRKQAGLYARKG